MSHFNHKKEKNVFFVYILFASMLKVQMCAVQFCPYSKKAGKMHKVSRTHLTMSAFIFNKTSSPNEALLEMKALTENEV